jgi:hypothetical protein
MASAESGLTTIEAGPSAQNVSRSRLLAAFAVNTITAGTVG